MTQPAGPNAIPPAPFPAVPPSHSSQVPIPPNPVWIQPKEPRATTAMVLGSKLPHARGASSDTGSHPIVARSSDR